MAIEKKTIPPAPFKGLFLDGVTVPGGLSKAENVIILADGTAERRPFERTLTDTEACMSGRGPKKVFELKKNSGERYVFANIDNSETYTSGFGAEEVVSFATWTATSGWTYGTGKWTHTSGTTALVATGGSETLAPVAGSQYHLVLDVTCPIGTSGTGNWTYTQVDSGYTWTTKKGNVLPVWLNQWTHAAGTTTALTTANDFTPDIGGSYVVQVHVTHTSGTGLTVTMGGLTLGTISATGTYVYTARYCTSTAALKFTPSIDWVGSIDKTWPRAKSKLDNWCSVKKLVDPAGTIDASNWDYSEGSHIPASMYAHGAELLYNQFTTWYPEVAATISQSVRITFGGTDVATILTSGVYEYDVTATNTTTLTITPTSSWTGSINSASVKKLTQATAITKTKVIGGPVTGSAKYEVTWGSIVTDLTSGDTIRPIWTTLQDRAFLVDGTNPNMWFEDADTSHKLGCPSPADAPTTASTTGGSITAGDYTCYYTYVKRYANNYVVEGNPSPAAYTTVAGSAISVSVVACTEADVTNIRIYRTLYSEPGSYAYFDSEILNITQTVTLVASDDDIRDTLTTLEFDHDIPPLGKYVLGAGSRLWLVDNNDTLHWSILDQPELMPPMNYQTFDPKDGDEVMGLCSLRKHILVFKRRRTWLLDMFSESVDDDGVAALSKDVVSSNIGCIATGSIQSVGTDSAIWLSHAGFMLYNGGEIRNISGGDAQSPSRIQSVINNFLAGGAEYFIDSAYHSARQLYHVNLLTRNDDGDTITDQRHFVYNLQTDSWTEYVYRNSAGTKMYETNFAMAHDALGNEVILIPYLLTSTGEVTYIYQGEYDPADTNYTLGEFNATGQDHAEWHGMCADADDNVYAVEWQGDIYKNTSGINGTFGALGGTSRYWSGISVNNDTEDVYACTYETYAGGFTGGDIYKQTGGAGTFDSLGLHALDEYWTGVAVDSNGSVYACSYGTGSPGTGSYIYKQTAGTGDFRSMGGTKRNWYGITVSTNDEIYACVYGGDIYKYNSETDTFDALSQTTRNWTGMAADTDGNVYACVYGGYVYKQTAGIGDFVALDSTSKIWRGIACGTHGEVYAGNFGNGSGGDIYVYLPEGYWEEKIETITDLETEPDMTNTVVHIVSNYTDLNIPHEKRLSRFYLQVQSENASCGSISIEPDYAVNIKTHSGTETSQPTGSVSMRPIGHPGKQTWVYTNDAFDSSVEAWQNIRADIGVSGKAFRYAIRMGDVSGANPGELQIRPPYIDVQIKSKQ